MFIQRGGAQLTLHLGIQLFEFNHNSHGIGAPSSLHPSLVVALVVPFGSEVSNRNSCLETGRPEESKDLSNGLFTPKSHNIKYLGEKRCKDLHRVSIQGAGSVTRNGNANSTDIPLPVKKPWDHLRLPAL